MEQQIETYQEKLEEAKFLSKKEHQRAREVVRYLKAFKTDLQEVVQYFQDGDVLKVMIQNLADKYCEGEVGLSGSGIDQDVRKEYLDQHQHLKSQIVELRKTIEVNTALFRTENLHSMGGNQELIAEISALRKAVKPKVGVEKPKRDIKVIAIRKVTLTSDSKEQGLYFAILS